MNQELISGQILSGLCPAYYVRFWLDHYWPDKKALAARCVGSQLFDFVVTWLGYVPRFAAFAVEAGFRRHRRLRESSSPSAIALDGRTPNDRAA